MINKEGFIKWLKGKKYSNVDEKSTEMSEDYEKEKRWELAQNCLINEIINKLEDGDFEPVDTKVQVKEIFDYGAFYNMANLKSSVKIDSGTFPVDNYEKALEFVYRLVINRERDDQCLECGRFMTGSCVGTIPRPDGEKCAAFYDRARIKATGPVEQSKTAVLGYLKGID